MASFRFDPLREAELPMLQEWLLRAHLQEWWRGEERTLEEIRAHYLPRIRGEDAAHPFLAWLDGRPVGYIQWYRCDAGDPGWWPDEPGPGVLGIDQFLADGDRLGRGLGTAMVAQFVARLWEDPGATEIRVDPRPDNARAIACYRKVGFAARGEITTPDGAARMMVLAAPSPG